MLIIYIVILTTNILAYGILIYFRDTVLECKIVICCFQCDRSKLRIKCNLSSFQRNSLPPYSIYLIYPLTCISSFETSLPCTFSSQHCDMFVIFPMQITCYTSSSSFKITGIKFHIVLTHEYKIYL